MRIDFYLQGLSGKLFIDIAKIDFAGKGEQPQPTYDGMYFTPAAGVASTVVGYQYSEYYNLHGKYLQSSSDGRNWTDWDSDKTVLTGTKLYVRGTDDYVRNSSSVITSEFFKLSQKTTVHGKISSLINDVEEITTNSCFVNLFHNQPITTTPELNPVTIADACYANMFSECKELITASDLAATTLGKNACFRMFSGCTSLVNAPALPARTLADYCYQNMFGGCTSLVNAPALPATSMKIWCYSSMFEGCTALVNAPKLPARTMSSYCYFNMFGGCTSLVNAPELPATSLATYCYQNMFGGCTSLVNAPELPATRLSGTCYNNMFYNCTSLVNAPALPATSLAAYCYQAMFSGCTSLVNAPALPASILSNYCYLGMFSNCTSLVNAPALPARTMSTWCYTNMFSGCTSLVNAPALPAKTLANYCYQNMFSGCTSLVNAPALPAKTLLKNCYDSMFSGCTSLTNAPALPATTLAASCYSSMFLECTSLVNAPALPATTLAASCYQGMFSGCTSLVTAPEMNATSFAPQCCYYMFRDCRRLNTITFNGGYEESYFTNWVYRVAATGTFYNNSGLEIPRGTNGIPNGWDEIKSEPQPTVTSIQFDQPEYNIPAMQSVQFTITDQDGNILTDMDYMVDVDPRYVTWISNDLWWAGEGTTTITAMYVNDPTITATAQVVCAAAPIMNIYAEPNDVVLGEWESITFNVYNADTGELIPPINYDCMPDGMCVGCFMNELSWMSQGECDVMIVMNEAPNASTTIHVKCEGSGPDPGYEPMYFENAGPVPADIEYDESEYYGFHEKYLQFSYDGSFWADWEGQLTVQPGERLYVKGTDEFLCTRSRGADHTPFFTVYDNGGAEVYVRGQLSSLVNDATDLNSSFCFEALFKNQPIYSAPEINFSSIQGTSIFQQAFYGTKITEAPNLPMDIVPEFGYAQMFAYCDYLTSPAIMGAIAADPYAFSGMYRNTYFNEGPEMLITTRANAMCNSMFRENSYMRWVMYLGDEAPNFTNWLDAAEPTGTFVMNINATWDPDANRGANGVPASWNIVYYDPDTMNYYKGENRNIPCDKYGNE